MRQAAFLILGQACANLLYFFQQCVDALVQHFEGNLIVAAFRNDDVGEFFARFDELLVHRLDRAEVLAHNGVKRTPSFVYITEDSADDSHIRVRIDEHLNVKQISEFLTFKNQNTSTMMTFAGRTVTVSSIRLCMVKSYTGRSMLSPCASILICSIIKSVSNEFGWS